jgi:dTDP-4-dehydrorhamnose 3,5-epimerase
MTVKFRQLTIPGAFVAEPDIFPDARGHFVETWRAEFYQKAGIAELLVQDSSSYSKKSVVRGLHYQVKDPQGQMVTIGFGRAMDVIVDLRRGSPAFLQHEVVMLDHERPLQVYMPPGVAHGFCVLSDLAILQYKATRYYNAQTQRGLRWNDPEIAIAWPEQSPIVSDRDAGLPLLKDVPFDELPLFN